MINRLNLRTGNDYYNSLDDMPLTIAATKRIAWTMASVRGKAIYVQLIDWEKTDTIPDLAHNKKKLALLREQQSENFKQFTDAINTPDNAKKT
jgi:hypothetical protein